MAPKTLIKHPAGLYSAADIVQQIEQNADESTGMVGLMVEAATTMMSSWEGNIARGGGTATITIDEDLRNLTANVLSKAAFGSSYSRGKDIFSKLRELQKLMGKALLVGIHFSRYIPTKTNREIKRLEKEIDSLILRVVKERMGAEREKDFLQMILEGAKKCSEQDDIIVKIDHERLIVKNCKNMYFAGQETTATSAMDYNVTGCIILHIHTKDTTSLALNSAPQSHSKLIKEK